MSYSLSPFSIDLFPFSHQLQVSQYRVYVYKLSGPRIHINHSRSSCAFRDAPHACIHPSSFLFIRPFLFYPVSPISRFSSPQVLFFRSTFPSTLVLPPSESPIRVERESLDPRGCPVTNSLGIKYLLLFRDQIYVVFLDSASSMSYDLREPVISMRSFPPVSFVSLPFATPFS